MGTKTVKINCHLSFARTFGVFTVFGIGCLAAPLLQADVVVLQSGTVITGKVLQQDANGVLLQMDYGTFRYPLNLVKEVKPEAATAPHVSNNGQVIPDWAQTVSLLANNNWADNLQQVPAPVISYGMFKNIPYISFRCATGGYELNIYGDLNHPAAVQFGAMTYNSQSAAAKSNCVNFVCSLLASADARKMVRGLDLNQKSLSEHEGMTFETILPGEWGSYGGWWVLVYNQNALAGAQASEAELLALAQARVAQPTPPSAPPVTEATTSPSAANPMTPTTAAIPPATTSTTYDNYYGYGYGTTYAAAGWTAAEINQAHPAIPPATYPDAAAKAAYPAAADKVYPRTYTRTAAGYDNAYRHYR